MHLLIEIPNEPGALARVAAAIRDAGVNISAATCTGPGETAQLHILVPHAEAAKHALRISNLAVTGEREVVVVEVHDDPGVLADLTRKVAQGSTSTSCMSRRSTASCSARRTSPLSRPRSHTPGVR